jgi:Leucine-rich repeat (LRR) protein
VQEFKDDESPSASNADYFSEKDLLVIDMSLPTAQLLINQMENYKSVKTLVVTGGKNGAIVNLNDILSKAAAYPLKELYIINFKHFVKTIPQKVGSFSKLNLLALFNNNIEKLPPGVGNLTSLKILYVDMNPLITLEPVITSLAQLDTLGVAKTKISAEELERLGQSLTKCKILEQ